MIGYFRFPYTVWHRHRPFCSRQKVFSVLSACFIGLWFKQRVSDKMLFWIQLRNIEYLEYIWNPAYIQNSSFLLKCPVYARKREGNIFPLPLSLYISIICAQISTITNMKYIYLLIISRSQLRLASSFPVPLRTDFPLRLLHTGSCLRIRLRLI